MEPIKGATSASTLPPQFYDIIKETVLVNNSSTTMSNVASTNDVSDDDDEDDDDVPAQASITIPQETPKVSCILKAAIDSIGVVSGSEEQEPRQQEQSITLPKFQLLKKSAAPTLQAKTMPSVAGPYQPALQGQSQIVKPFSNEGERKRSRREERDVELSLLAGDISSLDHAKIIDIAGPASWNSTAYQERRQKEAEVMGAFSGKGGDKIVAPPSRVQNKRHQINSLALQAAETELALLDARGHRSKTKSETQAKYGW
jgi:hypothetical protein